MGAVDELIENCVELKWNAELKISAMHWILLHLTVHVALENVAEESIMSFFKAFKIVLEHLIIYL